jgi:hypothetical protein
MTGEADGRGARESRERSEVSAGTDARDAREAQAESDLGLGLRLAGGRSGPR